MKIYLKKKTTYKTIIDIFNNKAWPGKVEIFYFLSLYSGIPLELLELVIQAFFCEKQYNTVTY